MPSDIVGQFERQRIFDPKYCQSRYATRSYIHHNEVTCIIDGKWQVQSIRIRLDASHADKIRLRNKAAQLRSRARRNGLMI